MRAKNCRLTLSDLMRSCSLERETLGELVRQNASSLAATSTSRTVCSDASSWIFFKGTLETIYSQSPSVPFRIHHSIRRYVNPLT